MLSPSSASTLRAGALRERVGVRRATTSRDATTAEETTAYTPAGSVHAEVVPLTARQAERAGVDVTRRPHRVTCRALIEVAPGDRLTWRGLAMDVLSVVDLAGRRRALEILAVVTS